MPGPRLVRRSTAKAQPISPDAVSRDQIATRAYEIFQQEGSLHGRDLDHWLRAETELSEGATVTPEPPAPAPTTTRARRTPRISA
jgi:hypothetical protein